MSGNILPTTFGPALDAFMLAKESEGVSPRTLFAYKCAVNRFASWLYSQRVDSPSAITPAVVRAYFADLHKHGYTVHTVHDYARPVKTLLRFWFFDAVITVDVMARVKMPPTDKKVLPALTAAELRGS
jgi:site-specific recombinase XerD